MKVLIAEDDKTSRHVLESVLEKWGYEVVVAEDGTQAWQVLQGSDVPPMAILDWMMPGIDGAELCRRERALERSPRTYIILLTALGKKEHIVAGLEAGADDHVTKPFDGDELWARVRVGERMLELQVKLAERVEALEEALSHVQTLQGILPICMHCHKIRTDSDAWQRLEEYIQRHADVKFSHGLCPECLDKYYPEPAEDEGENGES